MSHRTSAITSITSFVISIGLLLNGCSKPDDSTVLNGSEENLEHSHSDGQSGSHSHLNQSRPLHGGQLFSIGHTHGKSFVNYYYAEVLSISGGSITFYITTKAEDDQTVEFLIASSTVGAYINRKDGDPSAAIDVTFEATGDGATSSQFKAKVPKQFLDAEDLFVLVPKISIEGERYSFSFSAKQQNAANNDKNNADAETSESAGGTP